jgi:hypothetical protein
LVVFIFSHNANKWHLPIGFHSFLSQSFMLLYILKAILCYHHKALNGSPLCIPLTINWQITDPEILQGEISRVIETEPNSVSMSLSKFLRIVRISIHWTVLNTIWWTKRRSDVADVLGDFSQISQKIFGCIHSRLLEIFSALYSYRYRSFKVKSWIKQLRRKKY